MKRDFAFTVTAWLFLAAAIMTAAGWLLMPHHLGTFFQLDDFAAIDRHLRLWLWLYRIHLFGVITTAMAFVALAVTVDSRDARILVWPGTAVVVAGFVVTALASAFYYH